MTKTISETIDDLRGRLASIEEQQRDLLAEREGLAFSATVDREPKAVKRLDAINIQLAALQNEASTVVSALAEANRRELAAKEAELADRRRANALKAGEIAVEAEATASALAQAMRDMKAHSITLEAKFADIRRLTGSGPSSESVRVHLARALKSSVMYSPLSVGHMAPHERAGIDDIVAPWITSISNWIAAAVGKKPSAKHIVMAADPGSFTRHHIGAELKHAKGNQNVQA